MRLFIQRVSQASVTVGGRTVGSIGTGLMALAGFSADDGPDLPGSRLWTTMLSKMLDLRVFPDQAGKMNLSLKDYGGGLLAVPQFTLYADCRKGRRPSFHPAAPPDIARALYETLLRDLAAMHHGPVEPGAFGQEMDVALVNWGPVTILLDSADF